MPALDFFAAFTAAFPVTGSAFRSYLRQRFKEGCLDLTSEMMQVLHYLWGHDCVNQQEIANAVNRDKASLTSMLDNLVQRELVERRADNQDRRSNRIVLTTKGRALEGQIMPLIQEMYAVACQNLSEDQLRTTIVVLAQITKNLTQAKN